MKLYSYILLIAILIGYLACNNFEPKPIRKFNTPKSLIIKLDAASVVHKNGIGNEWSFVSKVGNNKLIRGKEIIISLNGKSSINLVSRAIEEDPNSDDTGVSILKINPNNLEELLQKSQITETVKVNEYYGNGAGNTAVCEFKYSIQLK